MTGQGQSVPGDGVSASCHGTLFHFAPFKVQFHGIPIVLFGIN